MSTKTAKRQSSRRSQHGGQGSESETAQAVQLTEQVLEDAPAEVVAQAVQAVQEGESPAEAVQQALEDARRRRSRKQTGGAKKSAKKASKRRSARHQRGGQEGQEVEQDGQYVEEEVMEEMEGGWSPGSVKLARLEQRLKRNPDRIPVKHRVEKQGDMRVLVPTDVPRYNKFRSFRAEIDGVPLRGMGQITRTNKKTGEKTTRVGETNRYFHGTPAGAAKKVVSQLQKGLKRKDKNGNALPPLPGSRDVVGIDKAVHVRLIEVTAGVRKSNGKNFEYSYYGWRDSISPDKVENVQATNAEGKKVTYTPRFRSIVVPTKGTSSAREALSRSKSLGQEIKQLKDMSASQRQQIADTKLRAKKEASAARKASRASKKATA